MLALLWLVPTSSRAQCSLAGSLKQFEPNPPGASRPGSLNFIDVSGFWRFQPPAAAPRLLVTETFGYQVVDLADPANPTALVFEDYRVSPTYPGPVPCYGDCHSSMAGYGIADDGARVVFGLNVEQSSPYGVVVGQPSAGGWGFTLGGAMRPRGSSVVAMHRVGSRYVAYSFDASHVYVADVTTLPGLTEDPDSLHTETTSLPGGTMAVTVGDFLVYMDSSNHAIYVVDISQPGPIGSIGGAFSPTTIAASDWASRSQELPMVFEAAIDPSDPSRVLLLGEFADAKFQPTGFSLMAVQRGQKTNIGGRFTIPAQAGESWSVGYAPNLVESQGSLYALMWGSRLQPSQLYRLYSLPVSAWESQAPASFDVDPATTGPFHPSLHMPTWTANGMVYGYVASGVAGWVMPMACHGPGPDAGSDARVDAGAPWVDASGWTDGGVDAGAPGADGSSAPRDGGVDADVPDTDASSALRDGGATAPSVGSGCGCGTGSSPLVALALAIAAAVGKGRSVAFGAKSR